MLQTWDSQVAELNSSKQAPSGDQLALLVLMVNHGCAPRRRPELKRLMAMSALLVKAHKNQGVVVYAADGSGAEPAQDVAYWRRLSMEPTHPISARALACLLGGILEALLAGSVPVPLEVVVLKLLTVAADPASWGGGASHIQSGRHIFAQLEAAGLLRACADIISRRCPLPAPGDAPAMPAVAVSAWDLAQRCAETSGQGNASAVNALLLRGVFAIPLLARRVGMERLSAYLAPKAWIALVVAVPAAMVSNEADIEATKWPMWLLGNVTELGLEVLLQDVSNAPLCDVFFTALNVLWDVLPKDVTAAMAVPKRDKEADPEFAGLLTQLRKVYRGPTIAAFFAPLLQPRGVAGHVGDPWSACRPVADLCFHILALRHRLRSPLLNALTFGAHLVQPLWALLKPRLSVVFCEALDSRAHELDSAAGLLVASLSHTLVIATDEDFYESGVPMCLEDYAALACALKEALLQDVRTNVSSKGAQDATRAYLQRSFHALIKELYARDVRRNYCDPAVWLASAATLDVASFPAKALAGDPTSRALLEKMHYVVDFPTRLQIFEAMLATDRARHQDPNRKHRAKIRRRFMVEDGLAQLNGLRQKLKEVIAVEFINAEGLAEAGIDVGGVFKEYLCELIRLVFSPEYGLFRATDDRQLFPNPISKDVCGEAHLGLFEFLGRMFGKAMYDGIVLDMPFAYFFLSRLLGRAVSIHELKFLDAELYRNLQMCRTYEGDVEDLGLTFSVTEDHLGQVVEKELIEGGSNIEVVPSEWLQMFNQRELQRLISGDGDGDWEVAELAAYTEYHGGYDARHGVIQDFWKVVAEFNPEEKADLLRFVTSCPRPPLSGFKNMHPTFKIQMVDCGVSKWEFWNDAERLPSSSTCFNLLKLPNYNKRSTMREKLKKSIQSKAGFEMS